ncbi:unnamed protein product [Phytomonas sp. Hart1]|nr:unnamed protein product [Phytomonas sp. Hart1]|eukprot:CCW69390.1 unnamed protein product [Phytomonas sp. isolate Hart1]
MIRRIDAASTRKISAGQVITDLSSVVKELLENSLDANASVVTIRLYNYGLTKIVVEDDGDGIPMGDVLEESNPQGIVDEGTTPLLMCRATTKLALAKGSIPVTMADFEHVGSPPSLGFRGEALHSLAQVSDVTIETLHESGFPRAVKIVYDHQAHNVHLELSRTPQTVGTIVTAENLFRPFPVRHKEFARNARKQLLRAVNLLKQYAVSHPRLRLVLVHQENPASALATLISLTGSNDLLRSVTESYGGMCSSRMVRVHWDCSFGSIEGFVAKVGSGGRMSTDHQIFSLDHRPVDLPRLAKTINDCFTQCLPNSSQKLSVEFFLQITMKDRYKYDVNLTPNKRKVVMINEEKMAEELREIALNEFRTASESIEITREARIARIHAAHLQANNVTRQVLTPVSTTSFTEYIFKKNDSLPGAMPHAEPTSFVEFSKLDPLLYSNTTDADTLELQSTITNPLEDNGYVFVLDEDIEGKDSTLNESCSPLISIEKDVASGGDLEHSQDSASEQIETNEPMSTSKRRRVEGEGLTDSSESDECIILSDNLNQVRERGSITNSVNFPTWENLEGQSLVLKNSKNIHEDMPSHTCARKTRRNNFSNFQEQTSEELEKFFHKISFKEMQIIGQFNHGFIIAMLGTNLFVIDQHASDEKYNYERLMRAYVAKPQPLVVSMPVAMNAEEVELALVHSEELKLHGFQVKRGDCATKLLVCSIPILPYDVVNAADVLELIQQLVRYGSINQPLRSVWHSMATKACRSSIMIGTALSESTMRTILNNLSEIEQPWACPHGRPTLRHLFNMQNLKELHMKLSS